MAHRSRSAVVLDRADSARSGSSNLSRDSAALDAQRNLSAVTTTDDDRFKGLFRLERFRQHANALLLALSPSPARPRKPVASMTQVEGSGMAAVVKSAPWVPIMTSR